MKFGKKEKVLLICGIILFAIIILGAALLNFIKNFNSYFPPKIKTNNDEIVEINTYIKKNYYYAKKNKNVKISYKKYKNNGLDTYVFKTITDHGKNGKSEFYTVYNIDTENDKIIDNLTIYEKFDIFKDEIEAIILNKLEEYMNEEIKEEVISKCSFEEYVRKYRRIDIDLFEDYYYLSVENNKLYVYLNMNSTGFIYQDYSYFKEKKYQKIEVK